MYHTPSSSKLKDLRQNTRFWFFRGTVTEAATFSFRVVRSRRRLAKIGGLALLRREEEIEHSTYQTKFTGW